jgi:3-oxoacyl-[acyl-carrier-protein] synthase III
MGMMIKSTSTYDALDEFSSIQLAANAGAQCIAISGDSRSDIDLLINIGVYRDKNILEPAMASLIQKRLQLNNDPLESRMTLQTFSFDLVNGIPSFINAIEIIDAMMQTGESTNALIVSSDTHPSRSKQDHFPFTPFGAAMLLCKDNGTRRPGQFIYETASKGYSGLTGRASFQPNGQNLLTIDIQDDYCEQALSFAVNAINKGIENKKIDLSDITAVIASQPGKDFGRSVAKGIGLSPDLAIDTFEKYGDTCSSALILGYHTAIEQHLITVEDKVLFVAVGSGLSMGCCVL